MVRVAAVVDRWLWLSEFFAKDLSTSKTFHPLFLRLTAFSGIQTNLFAEIESRQFKKMVDDGSVRVNKAMALGDVYIGPGTRVVTYLEPKIYRAPVTVIKHPKSSVNKAEWWKPEWNLVRKSTTNYFIIDKPAGISSIATRDFSRGTLVPYWLRKYIPRELGSAGILTTSRLDVGTHGLIVVGRNSEYVGKHNDLIESRNIKKHYTAVVSGWHRPHLRRELPGATKGENSAPQWHQPWRVQEAILDPKSSVEVDGNLYEFPRRSLGLWQHYIPERGMGEKEIPDPPYGEISRLRTKVGEVDHLRVISSRDQGPGFEVPVRLIVENFKEATSESVGLRAFPKAWAERLIAQSRLYNEPLYEIDIELLTGKTHQIRTQLECEGLAIVGDWLYGSTFLPDPNTFALCCRKLEWLCPVEKKTVGYDLRLNAAIQPPSAIDPL